MKIYTKVGDRGQTALFGAGKVAKDHVRVEAYGSVDELNASLAVARSHEPYDPWLEPLDRLMALLFELGAELATPEASKRMASITPDDIAWVEHEIDTMDAALPPLKSFILPMGTPLCASLHLARCVCRRAERRMVTLLTEDPSSTVHGLVFINRLSDFLFVMARMAQHRSGFEDMPWYPREAPKNT